MSIGGLNRKISQWFFRSLPSALLLITFVDDMIFGSLLVGARLAFGIHGLLVAAMGFITFSILIAAATS
jgi:hypothetical protein